MQTGFLEIWEPVTLVIRKDGINIKGGTTPVNEKFSPNTRVLYAFLPKNDNSVSFNPSRFFFFTKLF